MADPRFSIGIDLGTTNCAMAFTALDADGAVSEVFSVAQWESADRLVDADTLPSFLYLPDESEAAHLAGSGQSAGAGWICGRIARQRAGETPGRVAHSAKSWLGHHAVDRSAAFLPWGSDEIPHDRKISPIRASALLLNYLRGAWDSRFAGEGHRFDEQEITVTVPASFDAVAQRLTLDAAVEAGFPETVRLLEEPQAAFYRWLEAHAGPEALWKQMPDDGAQAHHVLVIDIGGGTSDFSLFEIRRQADSLLPAIRRVAVSDHLLLGGDNIDLAIAHLLEPRLVGDGDTLAGSRWQDLVARSRDLKERCLAVAGEADEEFAVSLPGSGSNLFAGVVSAKVTRGEVMTILLDGFYPECAADARPVEGESGLKEWGLPYAADSAITRHLADFLRDLPPADAVLFNGGSLHPEALRQRLRQLIASWQHQREPRVLENPEPDLAVARGAARLGAILRHRGNRIESGAARSVYMEIHESAGGPPSLVCILPRGAQPDEVHRISHPGLELWVNRQVRFQAYHSIRHDKDQAGALVPLKREDFHKLPPLQTIAKLSDNAAGARLRIELTARLTELGLLHLECVSADPSITQSWPLAFNLRAGDSTVMVMGESGSGIDPEAFTAAKERIVSLFSNLIDPRDPLTATRLLKNLEEIFGMPKAAWNLMLIRKLWATLERCTPCRVNSVDHEEAWLILAGFFLRPGFGAELDPVRMDELWQVHVDGLANPGKQIQLQEYILWRRVAGGLGRARQQELFETEVLPKLRNKKPPAELVRLAGALERIDPGSKERLIDLFLTKARALASGGGYAAPHFVALGMLLNRKPLYAGPEAVVSPDHVGRAFEAFRDLDWKTPEIAELFLRAARVIDSRNLDVPRSLRMEIARKLEKAGVPGIKVARVEEFVPVESSEQASLLGESLPPGLVLGGR